MAFCMKSCTICQWFVGFVMGIPRVGFSDTVPVPMNTVRVQPWVRFLAKPAVQGVPAVFCVLFNLPFIKENSYNIYILTTLVLAK